MARNQEKHIAMCNVQLTYIDFAMRRVLKDTLAVFRAACTFIGEVAALRWAEISEYNSAKAQLTFVEGLIHTAGENDALYPAFDRLFYKFPSYYRRSAVNYALGQVSSYYTRLEKYNAKRKDAIGQGRKFREKPPVLNLDAAPFPAMYKNEMYFIREYSKSMPETEWSQLMAKVPGLAKRTSYTLSTLWALHAHMAVPQNSSKSAA